MKHDENGFIYTETIEDKIEHVLYQIKREKNWAQEHFDRYPKERFNEFDEKQKAEFYFDEGMLFAYNSMLEFLVKTFEE